MQRIILAAIREKKGDTGKDEAEKVLTDNQNLYGQIIRAAKLITDACKTMEGLDSEYIAAERIVNGAIRMESRLKSTNSPTVQEWKT